MKKAKNAYEHLFILCIAIEDQGIKDNLIKSKDFLCKHYKVKDWNDLRMKMMKKGLYE